VVISGGPRRYKRYPAYKESGVEWLGKIPEGWTTKALKRLCRLQAGQTITADSIEVAGEYPVFGGNGIRGFTDSYTHAGEFPIVGRQGAQCGCVILASGTFWASEHAVVAEPIGEVDARWLFYLLDTMSLNSYSQSAAQPGIAVEEIEALTVHAVPIEEQRAVATFLNRQTAKIDNLIMKKQRLIGLLEEKRSALITRAVTKGLDPNVAMKHSGVDWLGQIPRHWSIRRFKNLLRRAIQNGVFKKKELFGSGTLLINVFDVYRDDFFVNYDNLERVEVDEAEQRLYSVEPGDIVFVRSSLKLAGVGRAACAIVTREPVVFECHLVRAQPNNAYVRPKYLIYYLNSSPARQRLVSLANTVTMSTIPQMAITTLAVTAPPLQEQDAIVSYLGEQLDRIDNLVSQIQNAIERLKELRTALISAAVTGKIDVRGEVA